MKTIYQQPKKRPLRRAILFLSILMVCFVIVVMVVVSTDFGRYKDRLALLISDEIGREFRIEGGLSLRLGSTVRIQARDIIISNAKWARDTAFVSIAGLDASIDLWSILLRPVRIRRLTLQGVAIQLEQNANGEQNWSIEKTRRGEPEKRAFANSLPVVIEALNGRDINIVISHPQLLQDSEIHVESISQHLVSNGLQTYLNASVNNIPVELESHIGPLQSIIENRNIGFELSSHMGEITFDAVGNIDKLFPLHLSYLDAGLNGPEIGRLFTTLRVPKITSGPLTLKARVETKHEKSDISLSGQAGEYRILLSGWLSRFNGNNVFDLTIEASGPDFDSLKHLTPADRLPSGPFTFHSNVIQNASMVRTVTMTLDVAGSQFVVAGRVDRFFDPQEIEGKLRIQSDDVSPFRRMLGLPHLPAVRFEMDSRLSRLSDGTAKIHAETRLGDIQSSVQVQLDDLNFENARVKLKASGPKADALGRIFDINGIPSFPFQMDAELWVRGNLLELVAFNLGLNGSHVYLKGRIGLKNWFDDTDLLFETAGVNLGTWFGKHFLEDRLHGPFSASGKIRIKDAKFELEELSIRLAENRMGGQLTGDLLPFLSQGQFDLHFSTTHPAAMFPEALLYQLQLDSLEAKAVGKWTGNQLEISRGSIQSSGTKLEISGAVNWPPTLENIDLMVDAGGHNLAGIWKSPHFAVPTLPFSIAGRIGEAAGFFDVKLSDMKSTFSFQLADATIDDVRLKFKTTAPSTDVFEKIFNFGGIPPLPFQADGEIRIRGTLMDLAACNVRLGRTHLTTDGRIFLRNGFQDSEVHFAMTGFDLAPWLGEVPIKKAALPSMIDASAQVRVRNGECLVDALSVRTEGNQLKADVTGSLRPFFNTGRFDLKLSAIDPAAFFPENAQFKPSHEPVEVAAVGNWSGVRWEITQASMRSATLDLEIRGCLAGTSTIDSINLELNAYGGSLAAIGQSPYLVLPVMPISINGKITGEGKVVELHDLSAFIGDSDVLLSASVNLAKSNLPELSMMVRSRNLDLRPFQHVFESRPTEDTSDASEKTGNGRVIPPIPIPFDLLAKINMQADIRIENLDTSISHGAYLKLIATIKNGTLRVGELTSDGRRGRIIAVIDAIPIDDTYELILKMNGKALCLAPLGESEQLKKQRPRYDLSAWLHGYGKNLRELATTLNGTVEMTGGKGTAPRSPDRLTGFLYNDFLITVFDTINPLNKQKDTLQINCTVLLLDVTDGIISGDPALVVQTRDVNFYTAGTLDLNSERLDLDIIANSRRGLGISIGDFINPFIKIGGTLAVPKIIPDPKNTLSESGAGILTGGLWPLAKKIRDRFLTGDPCRKALENRSGKSR